MYKKMFFCILKIKKYKKNENVSIVDFVFFFQAEDGIRDIGVTGVQTCALPIWPSLGKIGVPASRCAGKRLWKKLIASHLRSRGTGPGTRSALAWSLWSPFRGFTLLEVTMHAAWGRAPRPSPRGTGPGTPSARPPSPRGLLCYPVAGAGDDHALHVGVGGLHPVPDRGGLGLGHGGLLSLAFSITPGRAY